MQTKIKLTETKLKRKCIIPPSHTEESCEAIAQYIREGTANRENGVIIQYEKINKAIYRVKKTINLHGMTLRKRDIL